jgi:fructokinase
VITVTGEALIDLIVSGDHADPRPGGAGFNVARAIARLGQPVSYLCPLSDDRFGETLRARLAADGATLALAEPVRLPTTLALINLDGAGVPSYRFYLAGTSAGALEAGQASLAPGTTALHLGALSLIMEPSGTTLTELAADLPDDVLLMLDPNYRPDAVSAENRQRYLDRITGLLRRVDVLKTSTEDLGYLFPGESAASLCDRGPRCVLITDGAAPVRGFAGGSAFQVDVPPVEVVDTVGAGDAFAGAFLAWWTRAGLGRSDLADAGLVRDAARIAVAAAAVTCTRRGAEPPWSAELPGWSDPDPSDGPLPRSHSLRSLEAQVAGLRFCAYQYQHLPLDALRRRWHDAEQAGFDVLWNCDTVVEPDRPRHTMFDGPATLTMMAADTSRIRVGTLVTSLYFREPVTFAKSAMTVDHLSGGRVEVALGVGDPAAGVKASGVDWPTGERVCLLPAADALAVGRVLPGHGGTLHRDRHRRVRPVLATDLGC